MRAGQGLILIVIALLTFGVIMVNSAGLTVDAEQAIELKRVLFGRLSLLALLAIGMLLIGSRVPVNWFYLARGARSPVPWLVVGSVVLLLAVHLPIIGREVNGARRWVNLGAFSFQPSEVAKWGILIVLAWHCARRSAAMGRLLTGFVPPMLLVAAVCVLIATEDLGTAALIGAVSVAMLIAGGARLWHAALLLPLFGVGFTAAVIQSPYRLDRVRAFIDPYQDPQGIGYHMLQSMAAVCGGGLAGRGLGNSVQKFGYLPEDTTDFIFAIICEEFGIAGAAVIITLYVALLVLGFSIVRRAAHPFQRLLGLGVLLTIGLQALINIAVVTGVAPTKGIALPLLSSGGTGWLLTAFSVGLLVSMDREQTRAERTDAGPAGAPRPTPPRPAAALATPLPE
jgi:cell division protein FtsW